VSLFQIKSRFSEELLFELECGSMKLCVQAAIGKSANLYGADLYGADLRSADLRGADLRSADLYGADLGGANLRSADLGGANLRSANLYGADLGGANLRSANLYGADLGGANFGDGFTVDGKIGLIFAGMPNSYSAFGYVDEKTKQLRVKVGCQHKSINDGRDYWSSESHPDLSNRREVLAALDYIEAIAKLRGWRVE
jgi:uncharacterized protein YjbI with pentapeptide repeats